MSKENKILDLVVKGEWFDKIKSGEKTHEYRLANTYWYTRINNLARPAKVRFRRGYAKNADTMLFDIKSIKIVDGRDTDLHVADCVFDIELGEVQPKFAVGQAVFGIVEGVDEWYVTKTPLKIVLCYRRDDSFFYIVTTPCSYPSFKYAFAENRLFKTEQEAAAEAERLNDIQPF